MASIQTMIQTRNMLCGHELYVCNIPTQALRTDQTLTQGIAGGKEWRLHAGRPLTSAFDIYAGNWLAETRRRIFCGVECSSG
ncbi:hypothetical protein NITLEN_50078 [Nitrospira lenta]|uniref:Uncharacterized protein n=1 Tax=Nitrospira lenta TaxID=1436998 RepID=A0A330L7U2_9BACT|nr:hypothetical protein NITLEN_50078 [Nitrospira lenta]